MKGVWMIMLVVSGASLLYLFARRQLPRGWFTRFGVHLVLAAFAIYALNFSGWITGWYIPLNPLTVGAVMMLGLPGIGLVLGLQYAVLA